MPQVVLKYAAESSRSTQSRRSHVGQHKADGVKSVNTKPTESSYNVQIDHINANDRYIEDTRYSLSLLNNVSSYIKLFTAVDWHHCFVRNSAD